MGSAREGPNPSDAPREPAGRRHGSQVVQTMTKDEEKLQKFLDCTDSKKARTILESLDDWMLAGLVIWQEVNKAQKNWITKKLSMDPMEMFLKYWENKEIPKNSILIKTGHFENFSSPEIQLSERPTGCRGRHRWPNKQMKRGDVRLSIRLPNPSNPYYMGKDWDP